MVARSWTHRQRLSLHRICAGNGTVSFCLSPSNPDDQQATEIISANLREAHIPAFHKRLEPNVPEAYRHLACLVIVYDGPTTAADCDCLVSQTQKAMQPVCVASGLLLSELHPHSQVASARNSALFPSQPPVPIHFLRRLIPFDIPYILRNDRYDQATFDLMLSALLSIFNRGVVLRQMERLGKTHLLPPDFLMGTD